MHRWVREGLFKFGFELRKYVLHVQCWTGLTHLVAYRKLSCSTLRKLMTMHFHTRYVPLRCFYDTFLVVKITIDNQLGMVRPYIIHPLLLGLISIHRAQFARRDTVYYQASSVRQADAILVICTITSSPAPPAPPPAIPRQPVPRDLLDAMGSLLDEYVIVYSYALSH